MPVVLAGLEEHAVAGADDLAVGVKCTSAAAKVDVASGAATASM
jgi:hypothetical protein